MLASLVFQSPLADPAQYGTVPHRNISWTVTDDLGVVSSPAVTDMAVLPWIDDWQSSGSSAVWNVASSWSMGVAPSGTDEAAITGSHPGTLDLTAATTIASLVLNAPNEVLRLDAPLTVTGGVTIEAGTLLFEGVALNAGSFVMNGGDVTGPGVTIGATGTSVFNAGTVNSGGVLEFTGPVDLNFNVTSRGATILNGGVADTNPLDSLGVTSEATLEGDVVPHDLGDLGYIDSAALYAGLPTPSGTIATVQVLNASGATKLFEAAGTYYVGASGPSVTVMLGGAPALAGVLGGWAPIATMQSGSGFDVVFRLASTDDYTAWQINSSGDYIGSLFGVVVGTSYALENLERSFQQDLNGDGEIGPSIDTIETNGTTSLLAEAGAYVLQTGTTTATLQLQGSTVLAGSLGGWTPIGAEANAGGYDVAFKLAGTDDYTIWQTDSSGNYISSPMGVVAGTSYALEQLENTFQFDLNGDGRIGVSIGTIETNGTTALLSEADAYILQNGTATATLQLQGSPIVAGTLGGWAPIAAVATAAGYDIAWQFAGSSLFTIWSTDSSGNYTGTLLAPTVGSSPSLIAYETTFSADLNGDGWIGPSDTIIASNGTTTLLQAGNEYVLRPSSDAGGGVVLQLQGSPIIAGNEGGWAVVAAAATASGFEVAWQLAGTDEFTVWDTDANGNYTSSPIGVAGGNSAALENLEPSFREDINGDNQIGPPSATIATDGTISLVQVGDNFAMQIAGTGPLLQLQDAPVVAGSLGGWSPIGATQSGSGYQVVWKLSGTDDYTVWNTSSSGNYTNSATGVISGEDFTLQDLETTFQQDLNSDGRVSAELRTGTNGADIVDLSGSYVSATINLDADPATALGGLNQPILSFLGTPDVIILGGGAATIQYALSASSGIETVTGFQFGLDMLNIDLAGAPSNSVRVYDSSYDNTSAVTITSSADPDAGIVLLGTDQTAADLLANHVAFRDGHALVQ